MFCRTVDSGYPLLLSEMTILTALRTAATSAIAAKYLARNGVRMMALIGNGAQSEFQAIACSKIFFEQHFNSDFDLRGVGTPSIDRCSHNLNGTPDGVSPVLGDYSINAFVT